MIAPDEKRSGLVRVSMTLDAADVDLLDRLARLEGKNRSYELRSMLREARPVVQRTVEMMEAAQRSREEVQRLAASGLVSELEAIMPELGTLHETYLGALSRAEGRMAAASAADLDPSDPRRSNHGGHTPTPTTPPSPPEAD